MSLRVLTVFVLVVTSLQGKTNQGAATPSSLKPNWILTWSDEFDGPDGAPPDAQRWVVETGGTGWGNSELQYYTSRRQNLRQEKGNLVIEAIKEKFTGSDGVQHNFTSARLKTEGRFSQRYGRFEARLKVPSGQGMWPAFWMLGDDFSSAGWPDCGEIDIMEHSGSKLSTIYCALHGPGYFGPNALTSLCSLSPTALMEGFHVFALEWEPQELRFFVDDELRARKTPADIPAGKRWVYDHSFFVILNLAVGGTLPGSPDDSTVFPQRMLVDYVRVYSPK
jgi:beta-glucanase (GH16 family)